MGRPPGHEPALPHEARDAFARAFEARDAAAVRELVDANPGVRDLVDEPVFPFDTPPIVQAACLGSVELVDLLLELGVATKDVVQLRASSRLRGV